MVTAIGEAAWRKLDAEAEELTPQHLMDLSPAVVLAPHPDDETLGCGGLLAVAAAHGLKPKVAYLTDGAASHRNSVQWPPARLAGARRAEALAALAVLVVPAGDVIFLDWPDGAPYRRGSRDYDATLQRMLRWFETFEPRSLWAPRAGERHCDHAAACSFADDLARNRPGGLRRLDYMVWSWGDDVVASRKSGEKVWRLPCAAFGAKRRRALACHLTQTTRMIPDADDGFLIAEDLAALVDRPTEIFIERGLEPAGGLL